VIPLGQARVVMEGNNVTLIAWGAMLHVALEGARLMADRGVSSEVLDLRTLSPLDTDAIIESVKKTNRAVIVHEAQRSCGVAAEIAARINEKALLDLEAAVERVTGFDTPMPLPKLEQRFLPDAQRVANAIDRVMSA
jgi:pyruvate/2-oxoglutarate/acetoin dehydrogenase E1 component